jgi:hypothetical protein
MAGVLGFFNASRQDYTSGISGQALEDGANLVLKKITEGVLEPNGTLYRLATSAAYYIPNGTLNTLYYCQDNPQTYACGPADVTVRRFTVDATSTKLLYYYSSSAYKMIYTAPTGTTLTLRFSPASVATNTSYVLEIDVALNTKLSAKITNSRLATSGTASTFVLLRNHP